MRSKLDMSILHKLSLEPDVSVREEFTRSYGKEVCQFEERFSTSRFPKWCLLILGETDNLFCMEFRATELMQFFRFCVFIICFPPQLVLAVKRELVYSECTTNGLS